MIHPDTEVRFVSSEIGYGVFATANIPMGTLVYVKDSLEIEFDESMFHALDGACRAIVDKYSYMDERGRRVLSWDNAKYVNHSCDCNTISTAYGFEIALRDIHRDEEITDEYGLFNLSDEIPLSCGCPQCRGRLLPSDPDTYHQQWDSRIIPALLAVEKVPQPLMPYLDEETKKRLTDYLRGSAEYESVLRLKWNRTSFSGNGACA